MEESRKIFYNKFILSTNIKRIQYRLDLLNIMFQNLSLDKLQQDVVIHSFLEICRSVINIGAELSISRILCDSEAIINLVAIGITPKEDAEIFLGMISFRDLYFADSIEFTNTKLEQFYLNSADEFDRFVVKILELV